MRRIFYDLETTFLTKGQRRPDALILEIGAVDSHGVMFFRQVNPCVTNNVRVDLEAAKQNVDNTVRFWSKLLSSETKQFTHEKNFPKIKTMLMPQITKEPIDTQLFHINSEVIPHLTPIEQALEEFVEYIGVEPVELIGYNSKSFDDKVLFGNLARHHPQCKLKNIVFVDALPLFKKKWQGLQTYSLSKVYKHLLDETFSAHHALPDACALKRLFQLPHPNQPPTPSQTYKPQGSSDLLSIPGVGASTNIKFSKNGIHNEKELAQKIKTFGSELAFSKFLHTIGVRCYKKLGKELYIKFQ